MPNQADELEWELVYAESKPHPGTVNQMDDVATPNSLKDLVVASISKRSQSAQTKFSNFSHLSITDPLSDESVASAFAVKRPDSLLLTAWAVGCGAVCLS